MDKANTLVTSTLKIYTDDKATTAKKTTASTDADKTTTTAAEKLAAKTAKIALATATSAEANSKLAWDNAVDAAVASKTKYTQITTWVVSGAKYIKNDWDGSQAW